MSFTLKLICKFLVSVVYFRMLGLQANKMKISISAALLALRWGRHMSIELLLFLSCIHSANRTKTYLLFLSKRILFFFLNAFVQLIKLVTGCAPIFRSWGCLAAAQGYKCRCIVTKSYTNLSAVLNICQSRNTNIHLSIGKPMV